MKFPGHEVVLEYDRGTRLWVAFVPDLNGISTFGDTREGAFEMAAELVVGYLEAAAKEGIEVPTA